MWMMLSAMTMQCSNLILMVQPHLHPMRSPHKGPLFSAPFPFSLFSSTSSMPCIVFLSPFHHLHCFIVAQSLTAWSHVWTLLVVLASTMDFVLTLVSGLLITILCCCGIVSGPVSYYSHVFAVYSRLWHIPVLHLPQIARLNTHSISTLSGNIVHWRILVSAKYLSLSNSDETWSSIFFMSDLHICPDAIDCHPALRTTLWTQYMINGLPTTLDHVLYPSITQKYDCSSPSPAFACNIIVSWEDLLIVPINE